MCSSDLSVKALPVTYRTTPSLGGGLQLSLFCRSGCTTGNPEAEWRVLDNIFSLLYSDFDRVLSHIDGQYRASEKWRFTTFQCVAGQSCASCLEYLSHSKISPLLGEFVDDKISEN